MMSSPLFRSIEKHIFVLLLLGAIFFYWRGHHEPGGGFIAGLIAASAFLLRALAHSVEQARKSLWIPPNILFCLGLMVAFASGLTSYFSGAVFMQGIWTERAGIALGTPMLFDLGVFLVVLGIGAQMIFLLLEEA